MRLNPLQKRGTRETQKPYSNYAWVDVLIPFKNGARVKQLCDSREFHFAVLIPFKNGARVKQNVFEKMVKVAS